MNIRERRKYHIPSIFGIIMLNLTIWLLLFSFLPSFAIGLKVVREYPTGLLSNSVPWQIDVADDWTFAATEDGLIQFDGIMPEIFPLNNRTPVRSVTVDKENRRVYTGGINEFGYFKPSVLKSLEYVCLSDSLGDDRYIGNIWGIYPHDGMITVQGDANIAVYDTHNGKYEIIDSPSKLDCSKWIDGVLWLGTSDGLKFLMGKKIMDAPGTEALRGQRIRGILKADDGLYIVTADDVWEYNHNSLVKSEELSRLSSTLGEIFCADIHEGNLALGSIDNGVGVIDIRNKKIRIYNEDNGISNNTVLSVKFDDAGDLWAGLQYGMAKILLTMPVERLDNSSLPIGSGYVMTNSSNKLYLGTNRGLFMIDYIKGDDLSKSTLLPVEGLRGQVWGLPEVNGDIFCCHDRGLFVISDQWAREIGDFTGVWDVQKMIGSTDRAYVGTYFGLQTIKKTPAGWIPEKPIEGYNKSSYNFVQENGTVIWSDDGEGGINRITVDTAANKVKEIKNYKSTAEGASLTADVYLCRIDNSIFFSTDNGIFVYDAANDRIIKDKEISSLLGNPSKVKRLKKTNGSIYALTDNEILQADPAGILDMHRIPIEPTRAKPMHDKDLFFSVGGDYIGYPTRKGYLFFDFSSSSDSLSSKKPEVHVNAVRVTNAGDSLLYRGNFGGLKYKPSLKYAENSIRIEYGSPDAVNHGIRYSTRLNNEGWSSPSSAFSKEFTDLREGNYRFEVKAISPDGKESIDYFEFKVLPPWWRSIWVLIADVLLLAILIFLGIRLEKKRVKRNEKELLKKKEEEMAKKQEEFDIESREKDRQIMELEKEKLDKEVRHKAQELANTMMSLSQKNDILQNVKKDLQNILKLVPATQTDVRKALFALQGKVTIDMNSDNILKRMEAEFDIAHDNFMKNLRRNYPDLSNNEALLCAYLKMNLSTKEIATIMNISVRGVETMRYRLRKKLNLDRDDNLTEFISKEI